MSTKTVVKLFASVGLLTIAAYSSAAENSGIEFSGSGFMTLGVGKMLDGTANNVSDYNCPCFISDYAQGSVYDSRSDLQWSPDSKLGLQGSASIDNRRFSVTTQVVARGAQDGRINLEWLYASYAATQNLTLQAGRKRVPMFYYSDTQDIGLALPWTHLPPQLYGWEAVNYNGLSLTYQDQWGDWLATSNLLAGNEERADSGYWKIYNGRQSRTDVKWSNIIGGDLVLTKDWLETRLVYIQSDTQNKITTGAWDPATQSYDPAAIQTDYSLAAKQEIYGLAVNADYNHWLLRSEFIHINRPGADWNDYAQIIGGGYRYEAWQPMLTWANYTAKPGNGGDPNGMEGHYTVALTVRYDLSDTSAIKVQLDQQYDTSGPNSSPNYGNSKLLTLTYDAVFKSR